MPTVETSTPAKTPTRRGVVVLVSVLALSGCVPGLLTDGRVHAVGPDVSVSLQRRLDRGGGTVFLPKLGGGRCYQSRGLWVSHSDTTIASMAPAWM